MDRLIASSDGGRRRKEEMFLNMAEVISQRSTCTRTKVGCVIVDCHEHVMSTGYNGAPANTMNCCDEEKPYCERVGRSKESGMELGSCIAVHAEMNALLQCPDAMRIKRIYCTHEPCIHCAKLIANTSCKEVVYKYAYAGGAAKILDFLGVAPYIYDWGDRTLRYVGKKVEDERGVLDFVYNTKFNSCCEVCGSYCTGHRCHECEKIVCTDCFGCIENNGPFTKVWCKECTHD